MHDFSSAEQWKDLAREALQEQEQQRRRAERSVQQGGKDGGRGLGWGVVGSLRNLVVWPFLPPSF